MMTSRFDVDFVAIITNDLSFSIVGCHLFFEAIAPTGILFALRVNIVLTSSDTCISLSCKYPTPVSFEWTQGHISYMGYFI